MTEQEKKEFEVWHEQRLIECQYPPKIAEELREGRIRWLAKVKVKKSNTAITGAPETKEK